MRRSALLAIVAALMCAQPTLAQVQRLLLRPSTCVVRGGGGGGFIPTDCVDSDRDPPIEAEYTFVSPGILVQRFRPATANGPRVAIGAPVELQSLLGTELKLTGEGMHQLTPSVIDPKNPFEYEITVPRDDRARLAAPNAKDLEGTEHARIAGSGKKVADLEAALAKWDSSVQVLATSVRANFIWLLKSATEAELQEHLSDIQSLRCPEGLDQRVFVTWLEERIDAQRSLIEARSHGATADVPLLSHGLESLRSVAAELERALAGWDPSLQELATAIRTNVAWLVKSATEEELHQFFGDIQSTRRPEWLDQRIFRAWLEDRVDATFNKILARTQGAAVPASSLSHSLESLRPVATELASVEKSLGHSLLTDYFLDQLCYGEGTPEDRLHQAAVDLIEEVFPFEGGLPDLESGHATQSGLLPLERLPRSGDLLRLAAGSHNTDALASLAGVRVTRATQELDDIVLVRETEDEEMVELLSPLARRERIALAELPGKVQGRTVLYTQIRELKVAGAKACTRWSDFLNGERARAFKENPQSNDPLITFRHFGVDEFFAGQPALVTDFVCLGGPGDSILVRFPRQSAIVVVDTGIGTEPTIEALAKHIELMKKEGDGGPVKIHLVITHEDKDHLAGLTRFFLQREDLVIQQVLLGTYSAGDHALLETTRAALTKAGIAPFPLRMPNLRLFARAGLGVSRPGFATHGRFREIVVEPTPGVVLRVFQKRNPNGRNDGSLLVRVEERGIVYWLLGDAEEDTLVALVADIPAELLRCDVLKWPHHLYYPRRNDVVLPAFEVAMARLLRVAQPHTVVLLNKADAQEERNAADITAFVKRVLGSGVRVESTHGRATFRFISDSGERRTELRRAG